MNLRLLQLGDSALPIGGYSHSWALEAAVERGVVRDPAALEEWTRNWLRYSVAPSEGVVVAAVCRAIPQGNWELVLRANALLAASLAPPTLRNASREMGEQLLSLAAAWPWAAGIADCGLRIADSQPADESAIRNPQSAIAPEWHHAP